MKFFYRKMLLAFICSSTMLAYKGLAQNLVNNHSFETGSCPDLYFSMASQLPPIVTGWYSGNNGSPDPFGDCGTFRPGYDVVVPDILFGYQRAKTGVRFMGFGFYGGWYEYIGTQLNARMEEGETYRVTYSLSCADLMSWAASDIGIHFSNTKIGYPENNTFGAIINVVPQVTTPTGQHITDTTWQTFTSEYVAAGGEEFILIGYFKPVVAGSPDFIQFPVTVTGQNPKANPNYTPNLAFPGGTGGTRRVYYYIDDVIIEKLSPTPIKLSSFVGKAQQQKAVLNWTTETETNNCRFEIERSSNGTAFSKIASIEGAINSDQIKNYEFIDEQPNDGNNFYRLKQVDCDGKHAYSKIVKLNFSSAGFTISPNPVLHELNIERSNADKVVYKIFDQAGRIVKQDNVSVTRAKIAVILPAGLYILQLEDKAGSSSQKFIKL